MNSILEFIDRYKVLLTLSILIIVVLVSTTFTFAIPFKSYGDIWAHLSYLYELQKPISQIGDPYFHEGIADPHYGIYPLLISKSAQFLTVNPVIMSFIFGVTSIILFFWCAYLLYVYIFPDRKNIQIDQAILFLVLFFAWESSKFSYAGYFSMADMVIGVLFPHAFASFIYLIGVLSLLKLCHIIVTSYPEWYLILIRCVVITLLLTVAFLTHVLTGLALLFTYALITLYSFFTTWNRKIPSIAWWFIPMAIISFLLCFLWPYYPFIKLFTTVQTIHTESNVSAFTISDWLSVAGMFFVGLLGIKDQKRSFLVPWIIGFGVLLLSYMYPVRISSYWRFFPQLLIPLGFALTYWLSTLTPKIVRLFIIVFFLIFGFSSFVNKTNYIAFRAPINSDLFSFVATLPRDTLIFSDSETSYLLSGTLGQKVLAVDQNHWNPLNLTVSQQRYDDSKLFWGDGTSPGPLSIIEKYKVSYVLINTRIIQSSGDYLTLFGAHYRVEELYHDNRYILIKIKT